MSKILTADPESMFAELTSPAPVSIDQIEPAADPAFDALLRSFELEHTPPNPPRVVRLPAMRRDPYYLD